MYAKCIFDACCILLLRGSLTTPQVLAETGMSKAIAFDQIDKAPEEKARGITIATAHGVPLAGPICKVFSLPAHPRCYV